MNKTKLIPLTAGLLLTACALPAVAQVPMSVFRKQQEQEKEDERVPVRQPAERPAVVQNDQREERSTKPKKVVKKSTAKKPSKDVG